VRARPHVETDEVFAGDLAADLADTDATHWWFRSKASFVSSTLRRYPPPPGWLVDIGAGSAGVTAMLGWGLPRTLAVEGSGELAARGNARYAVRVAQASVGAVPIADGSASVVCLLDVIEHLDDPLTALTEAHRILRSGGRLVVTVPAHPRLWSAMDEAIGHRRRYTRAVAREQVEAAGFDVVRTSHIFSWLVLPVWLKRRARPGGDAEFGLDVSSPLIDRAALVLTRAERAVLRRVDLPFGTSILCVATRR
jgi:SAM-dependent methyltransferase